MQGDECSGPICLHCFARLSNFKSLYLKIIARTNKQVQLLVILSSLCYMTTIFPVDLVSNTSRVILSKPRRIKGIQGNYLNINVVDRSAEDHLSSILIPNQEGTKGMKGLKITSDGNCLNKVPCLHLLCRPIDHLHFVVCIFRRTLVLILLWCSRWRVT